MRLTPCQSCWLPLDRRCIAPAPVTRKLSARRLLVLLPLMAGCTGGAAAYGWLV